jgi:hypothetical protein
MWVEDPDRARRQHDEHLHAVFTNRTLELREQLDQTAAEVSRLSGGFSREQVERVVRGIQSADRALSDVVYGKKGLFTTNTVYRGNKQVAEIADKMWEGHLQNAVRMARATGRSEYLDRLGDPHYMQRYAKTILAGAMIEAGIDVTQPSVINYEGGELAAPATPRAPKPLPPLDAEDREVINKYYGGDETRYRESISDWENRHRAG